GRALLRLLRDRPDIGLDDRLAGGVAAMDRGAGMVRFRRPCRTLWTVGTGGVDILAAADAATDLLGQRLRPVRGAAAGTAGTGQQPCSGADDRVGVVSCHRIPRRRDALRVAAV